MDKIFLQIFNTAITTGWLVLAVLVARLLLKKAPAWIKCALWAIVAVRLVWPFSVESVLSLLPSAQTIPPSQLYVPEPQVNTGIGSLNSAINPGFSQVFQAEPLNNSVNPLQVASFVAGWVWVLGVALLLGYALISYLRLWRRVRVSAPLEAGVYLCDHISSPFILGIVRPRIYLPSGLPREKWEPILAHERAHLKRRDHWWKPLGFLLLTVFWFHPLLWVAYILLCRDVELACDERVIKDLSAEEKKAYSNTLLECSLPQKWITACPLAFGETGVKQRIKAVLHYKKPTLWILTIALTLCALLAVCFLTNPAGPWKTDEVFYVSCRIYGHPMMSFEHKLLGDGLFRVTGQKVLQHDSIRVKDGWQDVGQLEAFTLTRENFDDLFVVADTTADIKEVARQIRKNNKQAWRIVGPENNADLEGYLLRQKNGDYYLLYRDSHLFKLTKMEEQDWNAVAGKKFVYAEEGFGGAFYLTLNTNFTFQYYEGALSSHIGAGRWEVKSGKLYLYDEGLEHTRTYVFHIKESCLTFHASDSDAFTYLSVPDGAVFYSQDSLLQVEPLQQTLMWVQVVRYENNILYATDDSGICWKILTNGNVDPESFILDQCWVQYSGEPVQIQEQLTDTLVAQRQVTAQRCWAETEPPQGVDAEKMATVYDSCYYDLNSDGVRELCVLSPGLSSGLPTFLFSIWKEGTCIYERWVYEMPEWGYSAAFVMTDKGLCAVNSAGQYFWFVYADGKYRVISGDHIQ